MPGFNDQKGLLLSVFDRLLAGQPPTSRADGLRLLKDSIVRDLQWLLNTRRKRVKELPEGLTEVATSIVAYGLPDLSSFGIGEDLDHDCLRVAIEDAIRLFEPRLSNVVVIPREPGRGEGALHFRIEANIIVGSEAEEVTFETTLELSRGEYKVQEN